MIFGDPFQFAVQCDLVKEWNDDYFWVNGIYSIFINGQLLNKEIYVTELKFTLANIESNVLDSIKRVKTKKNIKEEDITSIFIDDFSMSLSSQDMEDEKIYIYCFFTEFNDCVYIDNKCCKSVHYYPLGYIINILKDILRWKNSLNINW
ncbi:hypothetical protein E4T80_12545 [Muribacter muris]|uniref:Uncharacterized protein n=1 Tax=Muribacter muris TaxID=67855 RepID=A0A4Y9JN49_9PAST|nr:Imm42 family immunity protein [Muribacter muris]MBF0786287.1 hypothetical protein [Muribacter muris]MBF0826253.1 hypothetical protein [Muribacter muris]TFV07151.1 hypothetical protein E4T80_12545 [Muribacter muris]